MYREQEELIINPGFENENTYKIRRKSNMRIISFFNQKGGVGKSTSTINIAGIMGKMGYKVLVVDLDPQYNTTAGLGVESNSVEYTVYDCIKNELPIEKAIISTGFENVDIVPSFITLANTELEIAAVMGRETLLKELINNSNIDYDFILLDLPPSLGLLTVNGLAAAKEIIIPVDCGVFALAGIEQLLNTYNLIKRKLNPSLNICGVLLTKVDERTNISKESKNDLREWFGDKFFNTVIHGNVAIPRAQEQQMPVNYHDPKSKGTEEYTSLVKEILSKGV